MAVTMTRINRYHNHSKTGEVLEEHTHDDSTTQSSVKARIDKELEYELSMWNLLVNYTELGLSTFIEGLILFFVLNVGLPPGTPVLIGIFFQVYLVSNLQSILYTVSRFGGFDTILYFTTWSVQIVFGQFLPYAWYNGLKATTLTLARVAVTLSMFIVAGLASEAIKPGSKLFTPVFAPVFSVYGQWTYFAFIVAITALQIYFQAHINLIELGYELVYTVDMDSNTSKEFSSNIQGSYGPPPLPQEPFQAAQRRADAQVPYDQKPLKYWLTLMPQPVQMVFKEKEKYTWMLRGIKNADLALNLLFVGSPVWIEQLIAVWAVDGVFPYMGFIIGARLVAIPFALMYLLYEQYIFTPNSVSRRFEQLVLTEWKASNKK